MPCISLANRYAQGDADVRNIEAANASNVCNLNIVGSAAGMAEEIQTHKRKYGTALDPLNALDLRSFSHLCASAMSSHNGGRCKI